MGHNDFALVRPIMRSATANWWRSSSIDTKFEVKNGVFHAFGVKTIPMGADDVDNGCSNIGKC